MRVPFPLHDTAIQSLIYDIYICMVIITECKRKRHKNEVWLGGGLLKREPIFSGIFILDHCCILLIAQI